MPKKISARRSPAKRPLTPTELAARRANAAKSTGPRTDAGKRRSAANALRSTGPRTPGGKQRSARNSLRHGLNAQSFLLPSENPAEFQAYLRHCERLYRPVGDVETRIVHHLARTEWKLRRAFALEREIFTPRFDPAAPRPEPLNLRPAPPSNRPAPLTPLAPLLDPRDPGRPLRLALGPRRLRDHPIVALTRYEAPLQKAFHRALLLLHAHQQRRLTARPDPSATPGAASSRTPESLDADLPPRAQP